MINLKKKIKEVEKLLPEQGEYIIDYEQGDLCEIFSEIADSSVDYYNHALVSFAAAHPDALTDAVEEGFIDFDHEYDFFRHIQVAEFYYIEKKLYEQEADVLFYRALVYIEKNLGIDELEEEKIEEVKKITYDYQDRLDIFLEQIKTIFEN